MTVIKWKFSLRVLACVAGVRKGRERGFSAREKREGRARKEGGERLQGRYCVFTL